MFKIGMVQQLVEFVKDIDCPCSKQDVVTHAEEKDAPRKVIELLEKLPDKVYSSSSEVVEHARKIM